MGAYVCMGAAVSTVVGAAVGAAVGTTVGARVCVSAGPYQINPLTGFVQNPVRR